MRLPAPITRFMARYVEGLEISQGIQRGIFTSAPTAGEKVDADTALQLAAFWGCVRYVSSQVALMPWGVYGARVDGGRDPLRRHRRWAMLHDEASPGITAYTMKQSLVWQALVNGNGYARIAGNWLVPLDPSGMKVLVTSTGGWLYEYTDPLQGGERLTYLPSDVLHVKGPSRNGVTGLSVISAANEGISLGLATQRYAAAFYGNGTHVGDVYETDSVLSDTSYERLKKELNDQSGARNSHKAKILDAGLKQRNTSINAKDAELLSSRQYTARDICALFGVPPHKIGLESGATAYASREQAAIEAVTDCLLPWVVALEQEADIKLLSREERERGFYTHLSVDVLMRGDAKSRAEFYQTMTRNGSMSPNEAASLEDMPTRAGGDDRLITRDLIPLAQLASYADSQTTSNTARAALAPLVANAFALIDARRAKSGVCDEFEAKVWAPVLESADALGIEMGDTP